MQTCAANGICATSTISVSSTFGGGLATYTPTRHYVGRPHSARLEAYGLTLPARTPAECETARETFARIGLERGYLSRYFRRPDAFIYLRLSPRIRAHARDVLRAGGVSALFALLIRLAPDWRADYLRELATADHAANRRAQWARYVRTGQSETTPAEYRR